MDTLVIDTVKGGSYKSNEPVSHVTIKGRDDKEIISCAELVSTSHPVYPDIVVTLRTIPIASLLLPLPDSQTIMIIHVQLIFVLLESLSS